MKNYYDSREKRQFFYMATCAMLMNIESTPATARTPRAIVNRVGELWDEIVHQTPEPKDDD